MKWQSNMNEKFGHMEVSQSHIANSHIDRDPELDAAELSRVFNTDGYVIAKGILHQEVLRDVRCELEKLVDLHAEKLTTAGKAESLFDEEPFETRLSCLYKSCLHEAPKVLREELHGYGFFQLFFNPEILKIVEVLLGEEIRLYPNYSARPKLPDWEGTRVLWHQDGGYTEQLKTERCDSIDALRMVNVWTPLVPAQVENGCMQFIPGTHKLGSVPHIQREHYLEICPAYIEPQLDQTVNIELDPGDVVLFHNLLFHQGLPNRSTSIRWSLDWRYQDATQPTMRKENGHLARSKMHPESTVHSPQHWASLSFT